MKNKHETINKIIKETGSKTYLEIGYGNGFNFYEIECEDKYGCDPGFKDISGNANIFSGTSDEFFAQNDKEFDVIFIDGLHHADQVRKDIINAMKCNPKVIILHDTLPPTEAHQTVPRKQKQWCGDVWRSAVGFHKEYPDVEFVTYEIDYGLTCIYPEGKKVRKHFEDTEISWEYFKKNAVELLNIVG